MKIKAKYRMALISKKNMKKIIDYFEYDPYDVETEGISNIVNYLIDVAISHLKEIDEEIKKDMVNKKQKQ